MNVGETPAFEKYSKLVFVPMPKSFEVIEQIFLGIEAAAVFLMGRNEFCVFHKMKKTVENCSNRFVHLLLFLNLEEKKRKHA